MDPQEANADQMDALVAATCRVAIIGAQRQRVAKVNAIIHANESLGCVATSSLLSLQSTAEEPDVPHNLPKGIPSTVEIEYLPCVATFDSYEDEHGATVRYLIKLEYHGPNGTILKGKSLAPFFDDVDAAGDKDDDVERNPFPGIAAVAIGCGIDLQEDVDKVQSFFETLSSSCASPNALSIECIQPNAEYSSMKEENEAFRDLSAEEKEEAVSNGTIGPGKMANFVYSTAKDAMRQKWNEELTEHEQLLSAEEEEESAPELVELQTAPEPHIPNPEKTRYGCKRCRTVLFGVEDLEDPPHTQSQHDFRRKKGPIYGNAGTCQNHCLAQPLTWMNGCSDMEGKLHCPKCDTKIGHYSWTGAQCSCGTWVTPAIMVPVSKVDEMKPFSHNVTAATGALFVHHHMQQPASAIGVNNNIGTMNQRMGGMTIAAENESTPQNVPRS